MLQTVGRRISIDFRQLPAVFALHWTEQTPDVGPGVVTGFAPCKVGHKPSFHLSQPEGPFMYRLQHQVAWRWALLLPSLHGSIPPPGVWNHDNIRSTTVVLGCPHRPTPEMGKYPYEQMPMGKSPPLSNLSTACLHTSLR